MAKSVLQVVNPNLGKADPQASLLPGCRYHPTQAVPFIRENVLRVLSPLPVDDCSSHFIQHDYALLTIFRKPLRDDENGRLELRKLREQASLLLPTQRIGLARPGTI